MDTKIITFVRCPRCGGTKIHKFTDIDGIIKDTDCTLCLGTGVIPSGNVDMVIVMDELDYIHGKVTAIWNKIKDL
jgi:hypothetical protein